MACVVHDSKYTVFNVIIFKFIVNLALYLFFCENSEILSSKGFYLLHCALISVFVACNRMSFYEEHLHTWSGPFFFSQRSIQITGFYSATCFGWATTSETIHILSSVFQIFVPLIFVMPKMLLGCDHQLMYMVSFFPLWDFLFYIDIRWKQSFYGVSLTLPPISDITQMIVADSKNSLQ